MLPRSTDTDLERAVDAILDDPKTLLQMKLRRATRRLLAERGLNVTMDEIAEAAGVNRRTLFRNVESRDVLVAGALSSAMDWHDSELERVVAADLPLREWITDLATQLIKIQRAAGLGYWQLTSAPDDSLPPELAAVNARRRRDRKASSHATARAIWQRASGNGECPQVVIDAVAITLSTFATRSMVSDLGRDIESLARNVGTILATVVQAQVDLHNGVGAGAVKDQPAKARRTKR